MSQICGVCVFVTGHSMAETLTVALRVAEEAIEEAIAKAEEFSDSLVRILLFCLICLHSRPLPNPLFLICFPPFLHCVVNVQLYAVMLIILNCICVFVCLGEAE